MPTILVVDDSAVDRRLVGGMLKKSPGLSIEFAGNGAEALEVFKWAVPHVVITDLQMPEMDGLELVRRIRQEQPQLPVILITAHGSERLAMQALESGAASYVPKSQIADRLLPTVQQVLAVNTEQPYEDLMRCLTHFDYKFELTSNPALIPPLVDLVQRFLAGMGLCDPSDTTRIGLALHEAMENALIYGTLELGQEASQAAPRRRSELIERRRKDAPYAGRKISVEVEISLDEARFTVTDEGPGFDAASLPDPADESSWESVGRGYRLMRAFMDEVAYGGRGNVVTLVKHFAARSTEFQLNEPA
ncbi:MAG: response regulator [Planctomycetes bacterium]|nr:response regulator [Planctomycetota bacterium]